MGLDSFISDTAGEAWEGAKKIVKPTPFEKSRNPVGYALDEGVRMGTETMKQAVKLPFSMAYRGVAMPTWTALKSLLGGTVRLTGKAIANLPFIPVRGG